MADLVALAEEIRLLEDEARAGLRRPIEIQVAIGEHLLTAKSLVRHGEFMHWLALKCRYTPQHARRLMTLARHGTRVFHLDPGISLRGAVAAINKALREAQPPEDLGAWSDEEQTLRAKLEEGFAVVVSFHSHERLIVWAKETGRLERIDRASIWGNPYLLGEDGDRATVIKNYREHYIPFKPSLLMRIGDLEGKALACWCAPEPCHGDVLLDELQGLLDQEAAPCHAQVLMDLVGNGH